MERPFFQTSDDAYESFQTVVKPQNVTNEAICGKEDIPICQKRPESGQILARDLAFFLYRTAAKWKYGADAIHADGGSSQARFLGLQKKRIKFSETAL